MKLPLQALGSLLSPPRCSRKLASLRVHPLMQTEEISFGSSQVARKAEPETPASLSEESRGGGTRSQQVRAGRWWCAPAWSSRVQLGLLGGSSGPCSRSPSILEATQPPGINPFLLQLPHGSRIRGELSPGCGSPAALIIGQEGVDRGPSGLRGGEC